MPFIRPSSVFLGPGEETVTVPRIKAPLDASHSALLILKPKFGPKVLTSKISPKVALPRLISKLKIPIECSKTTFKFCNSSISHRPAFPHFITLFAKTSGHFLGTFFLSYFPVKCNVSSFPPHIRIQTDNRLRFSPTLTYNSQQATCLFRISTGSDNSCDLLYHHANGLMVTTNGKLFVPIIKQVFG